MKYRPDIDGLRAVAVLPVEFYYAGLAGFSGGFVGVDVVRTDNVLCGSGFCDVVRDGVPLYFDSNHPSIYLNEVMLPHLQDDIGTFAAM